MRVSGERQRTVTVLSVVLTVVGCLGFIALDNGPTGTRIRELLGYDGRINAAVDAGSGGSFTFVRTQRGSDQPVGFSPCREIVYVVNPAGAPGGWEGMVDEAVSEVGARTGLEFRFEGTTDARNFTDRIDPAGNAEPVLLGWAGSEEVPELADDVAGIGGATALERGGRATFVTGMVVLDLETVADLDGDPDGEAFQRALLLHELGHLVGLDHVEDRTELMFGEGVTRTSFGPGDLRGLAELGAIPCD